MTHRCPDGALEPDAGDVGLVCSPFHPGDGLVIWCFEAPVEVTRVDPDTGARKTFMATFLAACGDCCRRHQSDPSIIAEHATGHLTWRPADPTPPRT
jgi:hypothetical protein